MLDLYLIISDIIPLKFHGTYSGYSIRPLSQEEKVSIEDMLFSLNEPQRIEENATAVIIPNITKLDNVNEFVTLTKFAFAVISKAGHTSFSFAATFQNEDCLNAKHFNESASGKLVFIDTMDGSSITQWISVCALARKNLKERMHITADRFVRYISSDNIGDGLMDLCISLESLVDSQTEVSFRFGITLSKILGDKGETAEVNADLLSELYTLRSKIAHGDPQFIKLLRKIEPKLPDLKELARRIITTYVLFMSKNSRDSWKSFLRSSLFS